MTTTFTVDGLEVKSGVVFEIAASPEYEVIDYNEVLSPKKKDLPADASWTFPPASVSALELELGVQKE